jgi:hypothetical protein
MAMEMKVNGIIHRRVISTNESEVALDVSLNCERETKIPEDSSYMVFVNVKDNVPGTLEEIALGSEESISLLSDEEKEACLEYVKNNYVGKENDFFSIDDEPVMRKARYFDSFVADCQYFNGDVEVNNGYGCNHPDQEEKEDGQGKCYCFSCPLGYPADEESLGHTNIEWEGGKPDPDSMGEDSYIILK